MTLDSSMATEKPGDSVVFSKIENNHESKIICQMKPYLKKKIKDIIKPNLGDFSKLSL